jgi:hypothetical protein
MIIGLQCYCSHYTHILRQDKRASYGKSYEQGNDRTRNQKHYYSCYD